MIFVEVRGPERGPKPVLASVLRLRRNAASGSLGAGLWTWRLPYLGAEEGRPWTSSPTPVASASSPGSSSWPQHPDEVLVVPLGARLGVSRRSWASDSSACLGDRLQGGPADAPQSRAGTQGGPERLPRPVLAALLPRNRAGRVLAGFAHSPPDRAASGLPSRRATCAPTIPCGPRGGAATWPLSQGPGSTAPQGALVSPSGA
jgi:hypothetical protein